MSALRVVALVSLAALWSAGVARAADGVPPGIKVDAVDGGEQMLKMFTEEEYRAQVAERTRKATEKAKKGDIHAAISTDNPAVIQMALDAGAGLNERGYDQQTPLVRSALKGWDKSVKFLLDAGADTTLGDRNGYTALHAAAFTGKHAVVRHLLAAGFDPLDRHTDKSAPLHRACWGSTLEHTEVVRVLIEEAGVPYDLPGFDDDLETPKSPLEQVKANRATRKLLKKYAKRAAQDAADALAAKAEQAASEGGDDAAARAQELADKAARAAAMAQEAKEAEEAELAAEAEERREAEADAAEDAATAQETAAEL